MPNTTPKSASSIQPGLDALGASRWYLNRIVEEIPESQMLVRTCPGGNHAMWCVGHIAVIEQMVYSQLTRRPRVLPEAWDELFAMGSVPSDDPASYPSKVELMRLAGLLRAEVTAWLSSLNEEDLATPVTGETAKIASTLANIPCSLSVHESVHAGQVSAARRATGKPALF